MTDCLIVGVGGQGTVLASRLVGNAALSAGLDVRGSETIGMAQRGGSVASHVRIGAGIASPIISPGGADVILAFEPCECARALEYLKPGGLVVVCGRAIQPFSLSGDGYDEPEVMRYISDSVKNLVVLDGDYIEEQCGAKSLNVAILGAAISRGALPFSLDGMEWVLDGRFGARVSEMNKHALRTGAQMASGQA
ncbi:MAG: indolepyruvate oxidoreductase subunit beta [Synergistaceae bacterium]|jgi:indolepyruvate ferredoxin oxidoreductase beta subunit|nr:indolepyruvate oxidoreductase subunit beta [Synergistaceae bacterium]